MKIIDFHTHPFVNKSTNTCFYGINFNFRETLKKAGITKCCGSIIEKTNDINKIKELNSTAYNISSEYNGFYVPGIHIHPDYIDESINELKKYNTLGVKLIGELVPYYNGWDKYYSKNLCEIYSIIEELNMVVSVHTQEEESIEKAVKEFKNITFVAAHPRDKADYTGHIERAKKYDNYYIDLSGTGLFRYGMLENMVNEIGSEKILFGTDFPICNPKMYVEAVDFENISDDSKENIYYKNAERLLCI